jgi:hypothetical protein
LTRIPTHRGCRSLVERQEHDSADHMQRRRSHPPGQGRRAEEYDRNGDGVADGDRRQGAQHQRLPPFLQTPGDGE